MPVPPSSSMKSLFALLAVISDPAATKERLEQIAAAQSALDETRAQVAADRKAAAGDLQAAALERARLVGVEGSLNARALELEQQAASLAEREAAHVAEMARQSQAAKELAAKTDSLSRKERDLEAREAALAKRGEVLTAEAERIAAASADVDARMSKLRAFLE